MSDVDSVAPGLIDIQVNGYRGNDFCRADVTVEQVIAAARELADAGVTSFYPTVTTISGGAICYHRQELYPWLSWAQPSKEANA